MFSFNKKTEVITDEKRIDEVLMRGVENIFPSKDFLKSRLMRGERLSLYLGIDPTGKTLHVGHLIPIKKLAKFQELGHQIIILLGDFTATIGDPTDKTAVRKKLSKEEVLNNLKEYKEQMSKIISFSGPNAALLKFNSQWLEKMKLGDVLELASLMTVEQMMKREMFVRRQQEGKPVYMHEFMYPLMQGFDSVAMDVDGEIGGNDQMFNMLVGRDLMKTIKNKEKFVITTKLLADSNGNKMGKTEGEMVALNQTPEDMFGRVMSWKDESIIPGFELLTELPEEEVNEISKKLSAGVNPRDFKEKLAREMVKMCHGEESAEKAAKNFESIFSNGQFPEDAKVLEVYKDLKLGDVLVEKGIVGSKSEFRRLIESGAISDFPDKKINDPSQLVGDKERKIKIGKKTFVVFKPK